MDVMVQRLLRNSASHGGVAMELAWWRGEADVVEAAEPGAGWGEGGGGMGDEGQRRMEEPAAGVLLTA